MPTRRFAQVALAQLLMTGCVVVFGLEHAQAQGGYVPPPTPLPPPVFNPSSPNTVTQPNYNPATRSTPIVPSTSSTVTPSVNEEPSITARSRRGASVTRTHSVHHHRGRFTGLTWPYYCGSSPCVRINLPEFYGYATTAYGVVAPVYTASTLWWPGFYDFAPGQFARGRPRYGSYERRTGYHGD
jgi:hypothetical protein